MSIITVFLNEGFNKIVTHKIVDIYTNDIYDDIFLYNLDTV